MDVFLCKYLINNQYLHQKSKKRSNCIGRQNINYIYQLLLGNEISVLNADEYGCVLVSNTIGTENTFFHR